MGAGFAVCVCADGINDPAKNPAPTVYSNEVLAGQLLLSTLPTAVLGDACNGTTELFAVTSDNSSQLVCQSGSWAKPSVTAKVVQENLDSYVNRRTYPADESNLAPYGFCVNDCNNIDCTSGQKNWIVYQYRIVKVGANYKLQQQARYWWVNAWRWSGWSDLALSANNDFYTGSNVQHFVATPAGLNMSGEGGGVQWHCLYPWGE
ncbi:MAG: hypothetical protein A3F91_09315 [Flavobacteria bacterium RIFCSPLOWO2_12_FULL_35_11]|nr:MAG: hypothetical protein A3F91_09315 [Flavobacteria bacterium RIFCSPLOWO2_12_FULL_35_11]